MKFIIVLFYISSFSSYAEIEVVGMSPSPRDSKRAEREEREYQKVLDEEKEMLREHFKKIEQDTQKLHGIKKENNQKTF